MEERYKSYKRRLVKEFGEVHTLSDGKILWGEAEYCDTLHGRSGRKCESRGGLVVRIECRLCEGSRVQWAATMVNILHRGVKFSGMCRDCRNRISVREDNGAWKGGRRLSREGYVQIRIDTNDPIQVAMKNNGYILEHRLVAARRLGRPLTRNEEVHHKNFIRTDNRPENLVVISPKLHGRLSYINLLKRRIRTLERTLKRNGIDIPR